MIVPRSLLCHAGNTHRPPLGGTSKRTAPVETFEPRIVPVSRDPLAAGLNGDGGVPGVLNQIAGGLRFTAQPLEQWPVTCPWRDDRHVRLRQQHVTKREYLVCGTRPNID